MSQNQRTRSDRGARAWTILEVLDWTAGRFEREGVESPRVDAEVLLVHTLKLERIRLYMDFDKPLAVEELATYRALVKRRLTGEPVAYITGQREFWSQTLEVGPAVLVPRPETELLVELALKRCGEERAPVLADVGTGSGAIAVALASELPGATVYALDCSAEALEVARRNAERHGVEVTLLQGDLLEPLADAGPLDLVVSNPPYVTTAEMEDLPRHVREFEPRGALHAGADGLDIYRRLVPAALDALAPGGHLLLEIGCTQGEAVSGLLEEAGFQEVAVHQDLAGLDRVVTGRKPA